MDKRTMYNVCKRFGSRYSDSYLKERITDLGSLKRWKEMRVESEQEKNLARQGLYPLFRNSLNGAFINKDVDIMHYDSNSNQYVIDYQQCIGESVATSAPRVTAVNEEDSVFTESQLTRIKRHTPSGIQGYGHGDRIYQSIGVLTTGDDDHSVSIGFELETNFEFNYGESEFASALDTSLGHFEHDGSINGVEFDSHPFSWNMMKKAKPLFEKMLNKMSQKGLVGNDGCGIHIHVGRNAFNDEDALTKFYYIINSDEMRQFWIKVARRTSSYAHFRSVSSNLTRNQVGAVMEQYRHEHGEAVNQQHENTIEVRIFKSTLNVNVLFDYMQLIVNLVNFCNSNETCITGEKILANTNLARTLGFRPAASCNVAHLCSMTEEQYHEAIQDALNRNDMQEIVRLGNEYQHMFGANRVGGAR